MNDLIIKDVAAIPLINRGRVTGTSTALRPVMSGWDLDFAQLHNWYRET